MNKYIFLDTETDGLHIINNRPFSYQYADLKSTPKYCNINPESIKKITAILSKPDTWLIGHNIKYDCHMLINAGVPLKVFRDLKIIDTMFMARLAIHHEDQVGNKRYKKPPMSLSLKALAQRYLGDDSREEELKIKEAFKQLKIKHKLQYRILLSEMLGKTPNALELNKYYSMTEADEIASVFEYDPIIVERSKLWFKDNPQPNYKDIPEELMIPYANKDIILTRGLFLKFLDAIRFKGQYKIFVRESKIMYPLLLMEREGLVIDKKLAKKKYKELYELRKKLNVIISPVTIAKKGAKILATYPTLTVPDENVHMVYSKSKKEYYTYHKKDMLLLKGKPINTKSSLQMAALYSYETKTIITTANKETRELIMDKSPSAKKIQLLRPLDKLIDTYLYRLINNPILVNDEWKLFGSYNNLNDSYGASSDSAGTVTGRLSSNLQQFPKSPLLDPDGKEIVNIRSLFIKPKEAYAMMYFDMSQLELRLQTIWSAIIDGSPDIVMARGFVPYKCTEREGVMYLTEAPHIEWTPTDFHSKTAEEAFGDLPDYEEKKKHYRSLGKRANFAIGYGASKWKLVEALKVSTERAEKLVEGWKKTYVGLTHMESYLRSVTRTSEFQTNLFGRKYYTREVHKLKNWLVQGSGGDLLKIFLARCVPFIEKYPHWKLMLTVHDEIDFVVLKKPSGTEIQELLSIMSYEAGGIDVTAGAEITYTSWADQKEYMV